MGHFKSSFDMTATQDLVQSQFQQKSQLINVLVCVIRNTEIKVIVIKI